MPRHKIGDRVRVTVGSGIDSFRIGRIVPKTRIPTDGRGIPLIPGAYKPLASNEYAVEDETGSLFTMFGNRLEKLEG